MQFEKIKSLIMKKYLTTGPMKSFTGESNKVLYSL